MGVHYQHLLRMQGQHLELRATMPLIYAAHNDSYNGKFRHAW